MTNVKVDNEQKLADKILLKQILRSPWVIAGIIMFILAIASPFLAFYLLRNPMINVSQDELENLAFIGDFLTGTTFLLGFSSILFVIASIFIQQRELQINTKVLEVSNTEYKELNKTTKTQLKNSELQHNAIIKSTDTQIFETSFYNLLNLLRDERKKNYSEDGVPPVQIQENIYNMLNSIFEYEFRIGDEVFSDFISEIKDNEKAVNDISNFIFRYGKGMNEEEIKKALKHHYLVTDGYSEIYGKYLFDLNVITLFKNSNGIFNNNFDEYLIAHNDTIFTKSFNNKYEYNFNIKNRIIDEYLKLIDIILESISKAEIDNRAFYFQVFKSQISFDEENFIRYVAYYDLRKTWRKSIEIIDEEFMRLDRGI